LGVGSGWLTVTGPPWQAASSPGTAPTAQSARNSRRFILASNITVYSSGLPSTGRFVALSLQIVTYAESRRNDACAMYSPQLLDHIKHKLALDTANNSMLYYL
jgi:hypothetical protein